MLELRDVHYPVLESITRTLTSYAANDKRNGCFLVGDLVYSLEFGCHLSSSICYRLLAAHPDELADLEGVVSMGLIICCLPFPLCFLGIACCYGPVLRQLQETVSHGPVCGGTVALISELWDVSIK